MQPVRSCPPGVCGRENRLLYKRYLRPHFSDVKFTKNGELVFRFGDFVLLMCLPGGNEALYGAGFSPLTHGSGLGIATPGRNGFVLPGAGRGVGKGGGRKPCKEWKNRTVR